MGGVNPTRILRCPSIDSITELLYLGKTITKKEERVNDVYSKPG